MNPHRIAVLLLSIALTLTLLQASSAQSPGSTTSRGKNGRAQERKPDETKRADGDTGQDQKPVVRHVHRTDDPQPVIADSPRGGSEDIRLAVDLVVLDAQVLHQKTGRVAGNLKKEDFVLAEDGVRQEITNFSQDTLPLSVVLLIDRGGCLDPFGEKVRHATSGALQRLRPQDEIALMSFADTTELIAGFGRGNDRILGALDRVPPHNEEAAHCFSRAFYEAADYMKRAGNPDGRRVIIVITGITVNLDCMGWPSPEEARMAMLESGSVVCGIVPKTAGQRMENGIMMAAAGIGGLFKARTSSLKQLAEETGGEILTDKPENLDHTFNDLIEHLRTRYTLGFVSTNRKRDGGFRKLKLDLAGPVQKSDDRLVVKTKRGYVAMRESVRNSESSSVK